MQVHILYLTNQCNLKCPYCYERNKQKEKKIITKKEINKYIKYIIETEPTNVSTTCLMGGEPLLEFDKIYYIFKQFESVRKKYNKQITLNFITNGTLLHKYIPELYEITHSNVFSSFEVSFDASAQYLRTGKSEIVQNNLLLLKENNIPFGISYTISSLNYKNWLNDLIFILESYYPSVKENKNLSTKKKIRVNIDLVGIEQKESIAFTDKLKKDIENSSLYLYNIYNIAICDFNCSLCKRCKKYLFTGKHYSIPSKKDVFEPMKTLQEFNHF